MAKDSEIVLLENNLGMSISSLGTPVLDYVSRNNILQSPIAELKIKNTEKDSVWAKNAYTAFEKM